MIVSAVRFPRSFCALTLPPVLACVAALESSLAADDRSAEELVVVGRLVSANGDALAPAAVEGTLDEHSGNSINVSRVELEDDGAEGFRMNLGVPDAGTERIVVLVMRDVGEKGEGAQLDLTSLGAGTHALGDVHLAPPPVLAAGRVTGADGLPPRDARVRLERRWMGARSGPPAWNVTGVEARTDREGRYELRGWVGTDELRVEARGSGLAPAARECVAGANGVDLVLIACGAIRGSVRLDAACGAGAIEIECARGEPGGEPGIAAFVEADGSFVLPRLPPGVYDLRVRARDDRAELVTVPGIAVRAGEESLDERVANLDLRGRVLCMSVRVELPPGVALPWGTALVRPANAVEYRGHSMQGSLDLCIASPSADVVLDVPGYRLERFLDLRSDRVVRLRPGLPVRLSLRGGAPALTAGFELRADLEPSQSSFRRYGVRCLGFDERGTALLRASEPGAHRPVVLVRRLASGEDFAFPPGAVAPAELIVAEGDAEQVVTVDLDRQALERLLEELRRER